MSKHIFILIAVVSAVTLLPAQEYQPTCKICPGTYIAKSEIDAYVKRASGRDQRGQGGLQQSALIQGRVTS
jgi:hypothetical protein